MPSHYTQHKFVSYNAKEISEYFDTHYAVYCKACLFCISVRNNFFYCTATDTGLNTHETHLPKLCQHFNKKVA